MGRSYPLWLLPHNALNLRCRQNGGKRIVGQVQVQYLVLEHQVVENNAHLGQVDIFVSGIESFDALIADVFEDMEVEFEGLRFNEGGVGEPS